MSYEDAVEEALCHGWIDSIIKRIDDARYARKFTPRTDNRNWSDLNKTRIARLIREGRMTEAGLAKVGYSNPERPPARSKRDVAQEKFSVAPPFMERALAANREVWENFQKLAPSHKRNYVAWITMAKREETRRKRLAEAIQLLAANRKLGLK